MTSAHKLKLWKGRTDGSVCSYEHISKLARAVPQHLRNGGMRAQLMVKHLIADVSSTFRENSIASIQGGVYVVLLALPLMAPLDWFPKMFQGHFYTVDNTVILFLFSFFKPVGTTVDLVKEGIAGNIMWFAWYCCVWAIFPYGAYPAGSFDTTSFTCLVLAGIGFMFVALFLNLSSITLMWMLGNFVYSWMQFLAPDTPGVRLDWTLSLASLGCTVASGMVCILSNLFPVAFLSIHKAHSTSQKLVSLLRLTWDDVTECYSAERGSAMQQVRIANDLHVIHDHMDSMSVAILDAWWESRLKPSWRHSRKMLMRVHTALTRSYDCLQAVLLACQKEGYDEIHQTVARQIQPHTQALTASAGKLLSIVCDAAMDGNIDDEERTALMQGIIDVKAQIKAVTDAFLAAKIEAGVPQLCEELREEHVFCCKICAFGHVAINVTEDILDYHVGIDLPALLEASGLSQIFDLKVILDPEHLKSSMSRFMKILTSFALGWVPMPPYSLGKDPAIAMMQVILTNRQSTGSAMTKNLARLQGVVMGRVCGHLFHSLLGRSSLLELNLLAYFLWVTASLLIYLHSKEYGNSYIGFLLAVFGSYGFVQRGETAMDPWKLHHSVWSIILALMITLIFDGLFAKSPSKLAIEAYREAWCATAAAMECVLTKDIDLTCSSKQIMSKAASALVWNSEAAQEPRFTKLPWKAALFAQAIETLYNISIKLASIEFATTCHKESILEFSSGVRWHLFQRLQELPSFQRVQKILQEEIGLVEKCLEVFDAKEVNVFTYSGLWEDTLSERQAALTDFLDDACRLLAEEPCSVEDTLLECHDARANMVAFNLTSIFDELLSLRYLMLRSS